MIAECLSIVLLWSSLVFDLDVPDFHQNLLVSEVSNLSCTNMKVGAVRGNFSGPLWSVEVEEPSEFTCVVVMKMLGAEHLVYSDILLQPSRIFLSKTLDDTCHSTNSSLDTCELAIKIKKLRFEPPSTFGLLAKSLTGTIERLMKRFVCGSGIKSLQGALQNRTLAPLKPYPQLKSGATPLGSSGLFQTVFTVINNLPPLFGIQLGVSLHADTTLRLNFAFLNGFNYQLDGLAELHSYIRKLGDTLRIPELEKITEYWFKRLPAIEGVLLGIKVPHPFNVSLEVSFNDLQCDTNGLLCSLPRSGGIILGNIRTENLGEWDQLIANHVGPFLVPLISDSIDEFISYMNETGHRFVIPMQEVADVSTVPHIALLVCMVVVAVILIIGTAWHTIWRYRRSPVTNNEGVQISLRRVLIEDLVLMTICVLTAFGFTWSNVTTAATLKIGRGMHFTSFSLMTSTRNMLDAGIYLFAILLFLFSGVYPYIKLVAIIVCTLVLEKPDLMLLKIINYFGKFSFLDSYAMIVMTAGLQLEGVAEVEILPGFYVFLASTIISILAGNYATAVWRRNTSLRAKPETNEPFDPETSEPVEEDENEDGRKTERNKNTNGKGRLFLRIFNFVLITASLLPAWILPCIRYSVTGLASVIQPVDRVMSLWELAMTTWFFLTVCIFTIGIAPVVYGVMYPRFSLLASWSAADALFLACVAGLLHIGLLVDYMLGGGRGDLYGASARLLWPMLLLPVGAVWQWLLAAEHNLGLTGRVGRCIARRKRPPPAPEA